jgi:hypothetical protein
VNFAPAGIDRFAPAYGKSEEEWAGRARAYLKAETKKAEVDYDELVRRLKKARVQG